jgi:hypothetical protein
MRAAILCVAATALGLLFLFVGAHAQIHGIDPAPMPKFETPRAPLRIEPLQRIEPLPSPLGSSPPPGILQEEPRHHDESCRQKDERCSSDHQCCSDSCTPVNDRSMFTCD